jgi:dihydrofolate reductase
MGRKTFESIGKALPGRKSIVITRSNEWQHDDVTVVHSIKAAIDKAKEFGVKEIFVIGGAEIFKTSFADANRIYLTRIHHRFDGDVYFPGLALEEWVLASDRFCEADDKNAYAHSFQIWERK